jgi:hypothetical protein
MLLSHILEQPWSKLLRRKMLNTKDAHDLYRQFQFTAPANPTGLMKIVNPTAHLAFRDAPAPAAE